MDSTEQSFREIYAPSKASLERDGDYYVEGNCIVAQSPLSLPRRCVKTNVVDTDDSQIVMVSRKFNDVNPWTIRLSRKRCRISYGLSQAKHSRLARELVVSRVVIAVSVLFLPIGIMLGDPIGMFCFLFGLVVALVAAIFAYQCIPMKVIKSSGEWFFIEGCSDEFLDAIEEAQTNASSLSNS